MHEQDKLIRIARQAVLMCMLMPIPVGDDVIRQRNRREFILFEFLIARRCCIRAVRIKLEEPRSLSVAVFCRAPRAPEATADKPINWDRIPGRLRSDRR